MKPLLIEIATRVIDDEEFLPVDEIIAEGLEELTHVKRAKLLAKTGFRFPTSDEWEYACSGGATTLFRWGDHLLQVTIYAWDADRQAWEEAPIAASDRGVWGKGRLWQHNLALMAAKGSERARQWKRDRPSLPPGRYLVKVHVDTEERLAKAWSATLTEKDYAGEGVLEARWQPGYANMSVLDAAKVRR